MFLVRLTSLPIAAGWMACPLESVISMNTIGRYEVLGTVGADLRGDYLLA